MKGSSVQKVGFIRNFTTGKPSAKSNIPAEGPGNSLSFNICLEPTLHEEMARTHTQPLPNWTLWQNWQGPHLVCVFHWSIKMPLITKVIREKRPWILKEVGRGDPGGELEG